MSPSYPLCYMFLPDTSIFSKHWGTVFRGEHFYVTVPCLYHLQQSFDIQTYTMGHSLIHCIWNKVASVETVII